MNIWKELLRLERPPLLIFTVWILSAGVLTTSGFSMESLLKILPFAILGHLSVFSINDYFDRDTDRANERKGGLQGLVVEDDNRRFVRYVAIISHAALGLYMLFLPPYAALSGFLVLLASFMYSAPPFRFKEKPFLDSACNVAILYFTFGVGVGVTGGTFADIVPGAFWFALIFGGPGHMAASYIDREADREAGIKTSAMVLGRRGIIILGQALILLALFLESWSTETKTLLTLTLIYTVYPLFRRRHEKKLVYIYAASCAVYILFWLAIRI